MAASFYDLPTIGVADPSRAGSISRPYGVLLANRIA
jgi:hypothetical protein